MAIDSVTVGDLISRLSFSLWNTTTVQAGTETDVQWALSLTMRNIVNRCNLSDFITQATVTTVADQDIYDLPDDFKRMIEPGVHYQEGSSQVQRWLPYYEEQDYVSSHGPFRFQTNSRPRAYTILGRKKQTDPATPIGTGEGSYQLKLVPTPDDVYLLDYSYYAVPEDFKEAALTDEIDVRFPRDAVDAIWMGAAYQYFPQYLSIDVQRGFRENFELTVDALLRKNQPVVGNIQHQDRYPVSDYRTNRHSGLWPTNLTGTDLP